MYSVHYFIFKRYVHVFVSIYFRTLVLLAVVRAFAHGAMGRRIDPSCGEPIELFLVPAVLHDWCNKGRVCSILSVGWCI